MEAERVMTAQSMTGSIHGRQGDRRDDRRISVAALTRFSTGSRARTTRLYDVSARGVRFGPVFNVRIGEFARVTIPGHGEIDGQITRLTHDHCAVLGFARHPGIERICEMHLAATAE